ncbi:hypothetical protein N431DRAFT_476637 [Stipitochalara longipes BDJ]|nr:hypothetical protein N431DRAFT_476637 [Stipitochalara longipes BDJ]
MGLFHDFNYNRPYYIHLVPVITSTATLVFSFTDCVLLRSLLNPSVPLSSVPSIWSSYIAVGNTPTGIIRSYFFGGGASVISGLICSWSIRRTTGPAKGLYVCGVVFSLLHLVFLPRATKLTRKIIKGPTEEAKHDVNALLEVQSTRRQLADLPAMMCFTLGFAKLCRLR